MVFKIILFSFLIIFPMNAGISESRLQLLAEKVQEWEKQNGSKYSTYKYPAVAKQFPDDTVLIFGYGSLLNPESAARTLSKEAMKTYQPALAFGMKRIFDRKVSDTARWGPRKRSSDVGMLNVFKTGNYLDALNGVTFRVNHKDLQALIDREIGYDLVPIPVISWKDAVNSEAVPHFQVAYVFLSPNEKRGGKMYTSPCVNPVPAYALASKDGAAINGKGFLSLWLKSTFLADKKTSFIEWEQNPNAIDLSKTCFKIPSWRD